MLEAESASPVRAVRENRVASLSLPVAALLLPNRCSIRPVREASASMLPFPFPTVLPAAMTHVG